MKADALSVSIFSAPFRRRFNKQGHLKKKTQASKKKKADFSHTRAVNVNLCVDSHNLKMSAFFSLIFFFNNAVKLNFKGDVSAS